MIQPSVNIKLLINTYPDLLLYEEIALGYERSGGYPEKIPKHECFRMFGELCWPFMVSLSD